MPDLSGREVDTYVLQVCLDNLSPDSIGCAGNILSVVIFRRWRPSLKVSLPTRPVPPNWCVKSMCTEFASNNTSWLSSLRRKIVRLLQSLIDNWADLHFDTKNKMENNCVCDFCSNIDSLDWSYMYSNTCTVGLPCAVSIRSVLLVVAVKAYLRSLGSKCKRKELKKEILDWSHIWYVCALHVVKSWS